MTGGEQGPVVDGRAD